MESCADECADNADVCRAFVYNENGGGCFGKADNNGPYNNPDKLGCRQVFPVPSPAPS